MLIHINDRSDLNETVCYSPKEERSYTRLEELRRRDYHRTDIVLINMTNSGREYTLHVTSTDFSGDIWILDILSEEQYQQVHRIADKMRMNALKHPECLKLLVNTL